MGQRVTAKDIALKAGVSRFAVSRTFTPGASVAPATRTKVVAVAEALGYRPNALARSLIKQESNLVAVVSGNKENMYDMYFFDKLAQRLQRDSKWGLLVHSERDEDINRTLGDALTYPVHAAIVRAGSIDPDIVEQCTRLNVPLIFTGMGRAVQGADSIWCDSLDGARTATGVLINRGCRKIAYVGGVRKVFSEESRRQGFCQTLKEAGIEPHAIVRGDFSYENGFSRGIELLTRKDRPDGIFCVNDAVALGIINAAKELDITIPEQLAVVGFDDIPMAAWPCFDMTTMINPVDATLEAIADTLQKRVDNPDAPSMSVVVKPELVRRGSA